MPKGKANEPIVESNEVFITVFYNCIIQNNEYLVKLNSRSEKNTSKCLVDKQMITVDNGESEEEEEKNDLDLKIIYFEKMRSIVINSIAISQRNDYGIDNLLSKHLFLKPTDTSRDLSKPGAAAAKWFTKAVLVDENDVFFTGSSYIFIIVPKTAKSGAHISHGGSKTEFPYLLTLARDMLIGREKMNYTTKKPISPCFQNLIIRKENRTDFESSLQEIVRRASLEISEDSIWDTRSI